MKSNPKLMSDQFHIGMEDAIFSECRKYRYCLWRKWDESKPMVMFIGLNPSIADKTKDDPTIRKVKGFARQWGYGGVYMMNLFAFVSTDPSQLQAGDPLGDNDKWLNDISKKCARIFFAWGSFGFKERESEVAAMFPEAYALKISKQGNPWHPLYVPYSIEPVLFQSRSHTFEKKP